MDNYKVIPPCCVVTVYADDGPDTDDVLNYAVYLKGLKTTTKYFYITRFVVKRGGNVFIACWASV